MAVHNKTASSKRGALLVSLGSAQLSEKNLRQAISTASQNGCSELIVCLLDQPELVNLRTMYGLPLKEAAQTVRERVLRTRSWLSKIASLPLQIFTVEELLQQEKDLAKVISWALDLYKQKRSFRNLCHSTTFRNLDPLLKRRGIRNQRDDIVKSLSQYLLIEIALKIFLADTFGVEVEVGVGEEGEFVERVLSGEYGNPLGRGWKPPKYLVVETSRDTLDLALEGVSFFYKKLGLTRSTFLLKGISFRARGGELTGIFGPSGSGKTTLLRLIAGHLKPFRGDIRLGNETITDLPPGDRGVVTVFQEGALFPHLSVEKNITYGIRTRGKYSMKEIDALADVYLERMGLVDKRHAFPRDLSGGEKQRVALARALIVQPRVLLLDEPTAALDHRKKRDLQRLLTHILTIPPVPIVIVVSHDRDFLFSLCNYLVVVDRIKSTGSEGEAACASLLASGTLKEILSRPPNVQVALLLGTHGYITGNLSQGRRFTFLDIKGEKQCWEIGSMEVKSTGPGHLLVPANAVSVAKNLAQNGEVATLSGRIIDRGVWGSNIRFDIEVGDRGDNIVCQLPRDFEEGKWRLGSKVDVTIDMSQCVVVKE